MRKSLLWISLGALLAGSAVADDRDVCGSGGNFDRLELIGLTADQRLVCFSEENPGRTRVIGAIAGLQGGETLVGIDFRPANGMLYGLGSASGVYLINAANASAMLVSRLNVMGMTVALNGTSFGVDFNPVPDRLRIISDAGQNLRVNVDTGATLIDGALNPAPGTGVTGAAYTNNDADPNTLTVLYDIDTTGDQLSIQAPPNNGTLNPVGKLTVNGMVQDVGLSTGFDIFTLLRNGSARDVKALAALVVGGQSQLFGVNLNNGRLSGRGTLRQPLVDLAIPLVQNGDDDGDDDDDRDGRDGDRR
jgi:hypothetical protein